MGSLALAPPDVKDVTLSLFAGLKTDIAPSDVPEGISPDTQDGIYLPGDWQSRPCLSRLYAAGKLTAGTSVLYEKTYVQPNTDPLTLLLTSDGKLWAEDVGNDPGNPTQIGKVPPGLYAQSVSEFGREYIAFSDLLHGQAVPLQYDGTNLDRVTQDGPGATPTVTDYTESLAITNIDVSGVGAPIAASTGAEQSGNTVTITTTAPHGLLPNNQVFITGVGVAGYNGLQLIQTVPSPTTFTYILATTGLANSGGGLAVTPTAVITATSSGTDSLNIGDNIIVTGTGSGLDNGVAGNPATWIVTSLSNQPSGGGAWNITFSFATAPSTVTFTGASTGNVSLGGQSSPGFHQVVCMFLTRQGSITQCSPPRSFESLGNSQWQVNNIPTGPRNVVARVLGFTGAGGDNFFIIPASVFLPNAADPSAPPIVVGATIVPDNTTTSFVFDVPDNSLFAATPIDVIGNDLFDQVVLGPVLGFFAYASRLCCWGDWNKIENFLNMGFCGGPLGATPLGWTVDTAGGAVVSGGAWANGQAWHITGDGTGNPVGRITQPAYEDVFGDPILSPNTNYLVRFWSQVSGIDLAGNVVFDFYDTATATVIAEATVLITDIPLAGGFMQANFSAATPATITPTTILRLCEVGLDAGQRVSIAENSIVFAEDPYRVISRFSYALNPEAFALTTGNLGPSDDESPIRCFALLRQSALLETAEGVHAFSDTTAEPDEWNVNQLTRAVGGVSVRSGDPGKFGTGDAAEDWALVAAKNGVYLFAGSEFWKVSQEISRGALPQAQDPRLTWDDINWAVEQTIVAKNDPATRRAYFAVPMNGALTPNIVFVLDYREMDTAAQIAAAPPLHITIQGKMKSSDLTRKWSTWNVAANDVEILVRQGNQRAVYFAGGNGQALGEGVAYGNIYSLDPAKLTDDDYGAISPYYTTYFFTDHDQEQALGIGSDIKLVKRIHAFIAGVGLVTITPIVNSLYNFQPNLSQRILVGDTNASNFLASDLEWTTVGLRGNRIAFRIAVQPLPGSTDVQIRLQKFVVAMMKDPVAQFRQSGV